MVMAVRRVSMIRRRFQITHWIVVYRKIVPMRVDPDQPAERRPACRAMGRLVLLVAI
jgi:hypothetical protein